LACSWVGFTGRIKDQEKDEIEEDDVVRQEKER
jgi:hypothetical protein